VEKGVPIKLNINKLVLVIMAKELRTINQTTYLPPQYVPL